MKYYLKVALLTLVVSIAAAELLGPKIGLTPYIGPRIKSLLQQETGTESSGQPSVQTLRLTEEETAQTEPPRETVKPEAALDTCIAAVKFVSLHPEFTQIPGISLNEDKSLFKAVWGKNAPARTMNADGKEVNLQVNCHVNKQNGRISLLTINEKTLISDPAGSPSVGGDWKVERAVSDIDNSTNVSVTAQSEAQYQIGGQAVNPELVLHCGEDKTVALINADAEVGAGTIMVSMFIDDDETRSRWNIAADRKNIFPDNQYIGMIRLLMKAKTVKFRFAPNGAEPVEFEFDLTGLSAAVYPLQQACHWS